MEEGIEGTATDTGLLMGLRIGIETKLETGDSSREAGSGFAIGAATGTGAGFAIGFATGTGAATGTGTATGTGAATGAGTGEVSSSLSFANGSLNVLFTAAILCRTS
jgi:hypothetical protein